MTLPRIAFVGMTHLAINSMATMAARGFPVLGFDPDVTRVGALQEGRLPIVEPDLPDYFLEHADLLRFTSTPAELASCDVVYVAPDVSTDDAGNSDLAPILAMVGLADESMRDDAVLIVLSQVPPGFTRSLPRAKSQLYYQVETLIFGRAVERAMFPERYIIGCDDPTQPLPDSFRTVLEAYGCPILPMRYESAELCKIAINMCLVSSVTTANTIAELCEKIGASWSEIVPALKLDRRIGPHAYLAAGLGISGGNLERDLVTFCRLADEYGSDAEAVRAWIGNSGHRKAWPARAVAAALAAREASEPDAKIGVLGLAYKENTSSTKNTPAFTLLESLEGLEVVVYDPAVPAGAPLPHSTCVRVPDALAAAMGADIVALMTPWPEFRHLDPGQLSTRMRGRTIIDPYALLDARACLEHGLTVRTLGRGAPVAGRL